MFTLASAMLVSSISYKQYNEQFETISVSYKGTKVLVGLADLFSQGDMSRASKIC